MSLLIFPGSVTGTAELLKAIILDSSLSLSHPFHQLMPSTAPLSYVLYPSVSLHLPAIVLVRGRLIWARLLEETPTDLPAFKIDLP